LPSCATSLQGSITYAIIRLTQTSTFPDILFIRTKPYWPFPVGNAFTPAKKSIIKFIEKHILLVYYFSRLLKKNFLPHVTYNWHNIDYEPVELKINGMALPGKFERQI
jgi:hypothetical protein